MVESIYLGGNIRESSLFIVIITFGVIFVVTATFGQGLASTIGVLKSGFKGQGPSQITMSFAKTIVVPIILIGLASILTFGNVPEIRMAVCVVVLTAGAPFIPGVTKIGKGKCRIC